MCVCVCIILLLPQTIPRCVKPGGCRLQSCALQAAKEIEHGMETVFRNYIGSCIEEFCMGTLIETGPAL